MRRVLTAMAMLLGLPLSVAACLWDSDTPGDEAKGLPEVVAVIAGRFERNPPLYYEMRLRRVAAHLEDHPEDLAAYDDAGVACDRLGRGDEAIEWMAKKWAQLSRRDVADPEVKDQLYRYHANLGTFLVHRWVRRGADRSRIDEVKAARDEIVKAIEINRNAHFGREKYQLRVLKWIIDPPRVERSKGLPNLLGWKPPADLTLREIDPREADDAVRGLAGLVVLGNAWESVDVFHALDVALQHDTLGHRPDYEGGRNALAYLAWLRSRELIDAGKGSMLPDAPRGKALKAMLPNPIFAGPGEMYEETFVTLRADADAWHARRTAFMMMRLEQGRHPDTDPHFWDGYAERPAPVLLTRYIWKTAFTERPATAPPMTDAPTADHFRQGLPPRIALLVALSGPAVLIAWLVGRSMRTRRRESRGSDDGWAEFLGGFRFTSREP